MFVRLFHRPDDGGGDPGEAPAPEATPPAAVTDRPEYIPEKFWDPDKNVLRAEQFAQAYTNLEREHSRMKQGLLPGVPKEAASYLETEGFLKDGVLAIEGSKVAPIKADDPLLTKMAEVAKEAGLSTDQFKNLVTGFLGSVSEFLPEEFDPEAEAAKLGENGKVFMDAQRNWLKGIFETGGMSPEQFEKAQNLAQLAEFADVVNAIRIATGGGNTLPITNVTSTAGLPSKEELAARTSDARYGVDTKFTEETFALYDQVYGTEPSSRMGIDAESVRKASQSEPPKKAS